MGEEVRPHRLTAPDVKPLGGQRIIGFALHTYKNNLLLNEPGTSLISVILGRCGCARAGVGPHYLHICRAVTHMLAPGQSRQTESNRTRPVAFRVSRSPARPCREGSRGPVPPPRCKCCHASSPLAGQAHRARRRSRSRFKVRQFRVQRFSGFSLSPFPLPSFGTFNSQPSPVNRFFALPRQRFRIAQ